MRLLLTKSLVCDSLFFLCRMYFLVYQWESSEVLIVHFLSNCISSTLFLYFDSLYFVLSIFNCIV